jgi:hypothetical protein
MLCHFLQEVNGSSTEERTQTDGSSLHSRRGTSTWGTRRRATSTGSLSRLCGNGTRSSRLARSEWRSGSRASTAESSSTGSGAGVSDSSVAGVENTALTVSYYVARPSENLRIDDMDNTVGNENIGSNDARAVNEDTATVDGDSQVLAVQSLEHGAILQARAVAGLHSNDRMIGENVLDLVGSEASESATDSLERGVVWRENGDVRGGVNGAEEGGCVKGTTERAQTSSGESVGSHQGQSKDRVDDVNDTSGEIYILRSVNM